MNTFDIVFQEIQSNGIDCDIKKKDQYGNLVSVRTNELEALGTKSIIASTSKLLTKLTKTEQLAWALDTKDEANELFKRCLFKDAMSKYVEALSAADFGNKDKVDSKVDEINNKEESIHLLTDGNVDRLIIPVLCNLAACCIELKEWRKTISFSEQALLLRPSCYRALLRKGIGYLNLGEYKLSIDSFTAVDEYIKRMVAGNSEEHELKTLLLELSPTEINKLPHFMLQARKGVQRQRKQLLQQRSSLIKAFNRHHDKDASVVVNCNDDHYSNITSCLSSEMDTTTINGDDNDHSDHTVSSRSERKHDDYRVDKSRDRADDLMSISELIIFFLQLLCDEVMSVLGWGRGMRRWSDSSMPVTGTQ